MFSAYVLGGSIAALLLLVIVGAIVVSRIRYAQQRKALERLLERYHQSDVALVRYVMLNRRCSEEVAYQLLATFVNKHVPLDDQINVDRMLAQDRQRVQYFAHRLLARDPYEIDKI